MKENHTVATKLRRMGTRLGIDLFGIADAQGFLNEDYQGNKPQDFMEDAASVIVIGVAIPRGSIESLPKGRAEYTNTLMAGTATLRLVAFRMARELENQGYRATIVPTEGSEFGYWYADKHTLKADMSIKYAAYLAGLGRYGYSHLLLTDAFGPRVRMTAIVTNAHLTESGRLPGELVDARCSSCLRCAEVCPAKAISSKGEIDRRRCADYMFNKLGGLRCGLCVKVCPS